MNIGDSVTFQVHKRAGGECEVCGSTKGLQQHHIVFRSQLGPDTVENRILLCWDCHHGTYGVHGREGRVLDKKLKLELQEKYFDMGYSEEKVRELMGGKLYLKDGGR